MRNPRHSTMRSPVKSWRPAARLRSTFPQSFRPQRIERLIERVGILVFVSHDLALVERLIVIADHRVVMDGPKEQVLQKLQSNAASQGQVA